MYICFYLFNVRLTIATPDCRFVFLLLKQCVNNTIFANQSMADSFSFSLTKLDNGGTRPRDSANTSLIEIESDQISNCLLRSVESFSDHHATHFNHGNVVAISGEYLPFMRSVNHSINSQLISHSVTNSGNWSKNRAHSLCIPSTFCCFGASHRWLRPCNLFVAFFRAVANRHNRYGPHTILLRTYPYSENTHLTIK